MYQTILAPIDGSDAAFDAARHAIDIAADGNGTVHVLFVIESKPSYTRYGIGGLQDEELMSEHRAFAEASVEKVADVASGRGVDCTTEVKTGTPYDVIVTHADTIGADAIVMGRHGYDWGGIEKKILGSTTERVLKRTEVPVITA